MVIGPDGGSLPIEITMRYDGANVSGTVQKGEKRPRSSFEYEAGMGQEIVYFLPIGGSGGQFREAWVNSNGEFYMTQLPPGGYRVLAFDRRHEELAHASEETMRKYESEGEVIQVTARQEEHLQLSLVKKNEGE